MTTLSGQQSTRLALGKARVFLLAGNPNSGKTTLFNALTGLRQKVANYPGVTVEKKTGRVRLPDGSDATIIDLPGTYSLISRSPDERVASDVIRGARGTSGNVGAAVGDFDAIVAVVDASNLGRNLYLVSQLVEEGRPLVVALTMTDIAERRGLNISAERLAEVLGVPVIGIVGHKKVGVEELVGVLGHARIARGLELDVPAAMRLEMVELAEAIQAAVPGLAGGRALAVAERFLVGEPSDGEIKEAVVERIKPLAAAAVARLASVGIDPVQADVEAHYRWVERVTAGALVPGCAVLELPPAGASGSGVGPTMLPPVAVRPKRTLTQRIDRWLVHRVWGFVFFAAVMGLLFVSIFSFAGPLMDGIKTAFDWIGGTLAGWIGPGVLADLVRDGVIGGVGGVLVFVPQIALLFLFLSILEDSGYLARAAFLMDRVLGRVGLNGKSFIPLLSSFACAIPGIMATRTIESRKERLATILVAPFMSCSARLPVYTLLITTFFTQWSAWGRAGIMLSLYALGVVAAGLTAWGLSRWMLRGGSTTFILELPPYKVPQAGTVLRHVWSNTKQFIVRAGTTILAISVLLWALAYFPMPTAAEREARATVARAAWEVEASRHPVDDRGMIEEMRPADWVDARVEAVLESEHRRHSFAGMFGRGIEPVIRPLGYDWKIGVGLVGAFAAREVFVSTMSITYAAGNAENTVPLAQAMRAARFADGRPVWTTATAVSLLVWFVLAMQCMSTVAVVRRETGGWVWPVAMTLYMNGVAYVAALVCYQGLRHFGW